MEAKYKISRGAKSMSMENTSGPGESTAEAIDKIKTASLHLSNRKFECIIPRRDKIIRTIGS